MAKKSKEFAKLLSQGKKDDEALDLLEKKIESGYFGDKLKKGRNQLGAPKMAEVLSEFISPYMGNVKNHRDRENLFGLAVMAWNLSLCPDADQQQQMLDEAFKGNDLRFQSEANELVNKLFERKQKFFADNKRFIIEYQVLDRGETFHLSVASTEMNQS